MKTSAIILTLVLALSASAAPQGNERQRGGGFFGQGGKNTGNGNNGKGANGGGKGNVGGGAAGGSAGAGNTTTANNSTAAAGGNNANNGTAAGGNNAGNGTAAGGGAANGDPQTSTTLDPKVIATGFANDGQDVPAAGQVASLTSTNNFINFCLTVPNLAITNGKQITAGSCNPAPMGSIPSSDSMPSSKFSVPKNGDTLKENTAFTITMAINNLQTGNFVNAEENYFAAPQQLNAQGTIIGHSHVVVEQLTALDQTTPTDPKKFAFFKGLNGVAANGVLTADVTNGLPAGFYKLSSINSAANHQPVLVPIAQHGSLDDAVYFTVTASGAPDAAAGGAAAGNGTAAAGGAAAGNGTAAGGAAAGNGTAAAGAGKGGKTTNPPNAGTGNGKNGGANGKGANGNGNSRGRRMLSRMRS